MRFFGDGGPETLDYLLHNLTKRFFFESSTLIIGYGALQLTTQAPKTRFKAKKMAFFGHVWAKNAVFFGDGGSETLDNLLQKIAYTFL